MKANYSKFYALLEQLTYPGDKNQLKKQLVLRFTNKRSISLHDMTSYEYEQMCTAIQKEVKREPDNIQQLRKFRSAVLIRLQKLGIDTTNWECVDKFCMDKRIAGKRFCKISLEGLKALIPKLEGIKQKDGNSLENNLPKHLLN